jgi:hypothetical protein
LKIVFFVAVNILVLHYHAYSLRVVKESNVITKHWFRKTSWWQRNCTNHHYFFTATCLRFQKQPLSVKVIFSLGNTSRNIHWLEVVAINLARLSCNGDISYVKVDPNSRWHFLNIDLNARKNALLECRTDLLQITDRFWILSPLNLI